VRSSSGPHTAHLTEQLVCVVADRKRRRQRRVPPGPKRLEGVCWIGHTT
jgi:hypothetical protein